MAVRTFEGVVENGQIRLRQPVSLPEHTKVYVVIPDMDGGPQAHVRSPRLLRPEQVQEFVKEIVEGKSDAGL